jgi:sterol desaturase/sphingolipid hydroxylase (fatty acid hydroxylase superfamily)
MKPAVVAGVLLVVLLVAFNAASAALAAKFDYPDILRKPTQEILQRFRDGGSRLVLLWWSFVMTAVLLAPAAVLLSGALAGADATLLSVGSATGVLAAVVQFLGLIRWPFLVPYLARAATDPGATEARKEAVDVVFQSFNRYLGVAVGEHLGYLFTGG